MAQMFLAEQLAFVKISCFSEIIINVFIVCFDMLPKDFSTCFVFVLF